MRAAAGWDGCGRVGGEGLADRRPPLVAAGGLPDHHDQAGSRPQSRPDGAERGNRVGEEHRAEPADAHVEVLYREAELNAGQPPHYRRANKRRSPRFVFLLHSTSSNRQWPLPY